MSDIEYQEVPPHLSPEALGRLTVPELRELECRLGCSLREACDPYKIKEN